MSYPIVRRGMVVTPEHTGYGASVERLQKRYSKKDLAKLQSKLGKYQATLAKLQGKGKSNFRTRNLEKKIQALQMVLGLQPFDASIQAEAQAIADQEASASVSPIVWWSLGLLFVGGATFMIVKARK